MKIKKYLEILWREFSTKRFVESFRIEDNDLRELRSLGVDTDELQSNLGMVKKQGLIISSQIEDVKANPQSRHQNLLKKRII